jgi:hypothetical protein
MGRCGVGQVAPEHPGRVIISPGQEGAAAAGQVEGQQLWAAPDTGAPPVCRGYAVRCAIFTRWAAVGAPAKDSPGFRNGRSQSMADQEQVKLLLAGAFRASLKKGF